RVRRCWWSTARTTAPGRHRARTTWRNGWAPSGCAYRGRPTRPPSKPRRLPPVFSPRSGTRWRPPCAGGDSILGQPVPGPVRGSGRLPFRAQHPVVAPATGRTWTGREDGIHLRRRRQPGPEPLVGARALGGDVLGTPQVPADAFVGVLPGVHG